MLELDIIASFEQILASLMFECAGGAVRRKEGRRIVVGFRSRNEKSCFVDFENSIRVRVYFERRKQPTGKCCVISFPVLFSRNNRTKMESLRGIIIFRQQKDSSQE